MDIEQEQQLLRKAKKSLEAFGELYNYYLPKIYAYVFNRLGDRHAAEDITSITFVKAIDNIKKYQDRGQRFGAWLYKIAHNLIIDFFKEHNTFKIYNYDEAIKSIDDIFAEEDSRLIEKEENKRMVLEVMRLLPRTYQQILSLKFFAELENEEIAEILNCSKSTLAVKLHRSLNSFKQKFNKIFKQELL
ncbi:MAG TPA: RNA polymerase sigma factor [Candidatus Dojkabacteria bacterium]|nr:RNA polymerase sigma factor [Candidatus Dojkabacteria bacterium]